MIKNSHRRWGDEDGNTDLEDNKEDHAETLNQAPKENELHPIEETKLDTNSQTLKDYLDLTTLMGKLWFSNSTSNTAPHMGFFSETEMEIPNFQDVILRNRENLLKRFVQVIDEMGTKRVESFKFI